MLVARPELFKAAELLIRITSQLRRQCECSGCDFFGAFNFTRGFCESSFLRFTANNIHLFASCDIFEHFQVAWLVPALLGNRLRPGYSASTSGCAPTKWRLLEKVLCSKLNVADFFSFSLSKHGNLSVFIFLLGIWRPYKELQALVERSLFKKRPEVYHELEVALKKFKPDLTSLLKNPVS